MVPIVNDGKIMNGQIHMQNTLEALKREKVFE